MANPQPKDAHIIITHSIQENLIIRNFSELQLKLIYLIIRLSWGCGLKAWQYKSYKDFEVIGIYKSDVTTHLNYLQVNMVVDWFEKYNLLIFNKDFDQWKIPINKKSSNAFIKKLIHESLEKTNEVRQLLTVLVKIPNGVSKNPEQFETETPTNESVCGAPKESIKESIITTITTDENLDLSEENIVEEIANYYLTKTGRLANSQDYIAITEVLDRPITVPTSYKSRIEIIKQAMDRMTEKHIKRNGEFDNRINAFAFYRNGIFDDFRKLEIKTTGGDGDGWGRKHKNCDAGGDSEPIEGLGIIV